MPKAPSQEVSAQRTEASDAADRGARQLLNIPQLTADQQQYLSKIEISSGAYDPEAVICGAKLD